jgi:hypothetical protein
MRVVKSILGLVLVFALINGGLWFYYKTVNGDVHNEVNELETYFDDTEEELDELVEKANNETDEAVYNELVDEYNALNDEYNENIDRYNEAIEVMNNEFYLIPIPLGKSDK